MRRPSLILVISVVGGWAFGLLDSRIPMPSSSTVFWTGNLGAPWLVLPFLAGWTSPSRRRAILGGALTPASPLWSASSVRDRAGDRRPSSSSPAGLQPVRSLAGSMVASGSPGAARGRCRKSAGSGRALHSRAAGLVVGFRLLAGPPAHLVCRTGLRSGAPGLGGRVEPRFLVEQDRGALSSLLGWRVPLDRRTPPWRLRSPLRQLPGAQRVLARGLAPSVCLVAASACLVAFAGPRKAPATWGLCHEEGPDLSRARFPLLPCLGRSRLCRNFPAVRHRGRRCATEEHGAGDFPL